MTSRGIWKLVIGGCLIALSGCATAVGPPEDLLKRVPVIEIGQSEPADKHYVLFVRAGKPVPMQLTVKGPLLVQPGQAATQIQFTQSFYIYRDWSSLDGINWTHRVFEGAASIGLAAKGGIVEIAVDRTR